MKRLLLLALAATSTGALFAQTASDVIIDRAQQPTPPPAPTAAATKADGERGDLDGGTQRLAETRKLPFKLTLAYDGQIYYTDNVFLQANNKVEAVVIASTLLARVEGNSIPVGSTLLTPSAGVVFQRFNHDKFDHNQPRENLDFDAYSVPLALRLRFGDNWEITAGVTGTAVYSLEGPPDYNLTYQALTGYVAARKLIAIGRNQIISLGATVGYVKTKSDTPTALPFPLVSYRDDRNDKLDTSFDAGYYYLKGPWTVGPYARVTYSDYSHFEEVGSGAADSVNRRDLTSSVGLSVSYAFTRWGTARVFTSYDWRNPQGEQSAANDYAYKSANVGIGATLSTSF